METGSPYSSNASRNTGSASSSVSPGRGAERMQSLLWSSRMFSTWHLTPPPIRNHPLKSVCHMSFGSSLTNLTQGVAARLASGVMSPFRLRTLFTVLTLGTATSPAFFSRKCIFLAPRLGNRLRHSIMSASVSGLMRLWTWNA